MYSTVIVSIILFYFATCAIAIIVNVKLKKDGFQGIPFVECFYPTKHLSFMIGYVVSLIPFWIIEQYVIRFYHPNCNRCIKQKKCVDEFGNSSCGCDPYKKACSPFESCYFGYYGPITFNKTKAINRISKFKIEVKDVA